MNKVELICEVSTTPAPPAIPGWTHVKTEGAGDETDWLYRFDADPTIKEIVNPDDEIDDPILPTRIISEHWDPDIHWFKDWVVAITPPFDTVLNGKNVRAYQATATHATTGKVIMVMEVIDPFRDIAERRPAETLLFTQVMDSIRSGVIDAIY